jgi:ribonuclease T2
MKARVYVCLITVVLACLPHAFAQQKGTPGKFDFFLLNIVPSQEFCAIKDVGSACHSQDGFVLHGLWAQNDDGTYPVFCAERPGPKHPEKNLDITPDLGLLAHEWAKHGTCTTLKPDAFFHAEHKAYRDFVVPPEIAMLKAAVTLAPEAIVAEFESANPKYPHGSVIVWCSAKKLMSVSACLSKDLKPIACQGLKSCAEAAISVGPMQPAPASH